jgi:excisionase family DNA binding protein
MAPDMAKRLSSIKEAADEWGMSEWTLRDLIASANLPAIRPPNKRRVLIHRRDLEHAIEAWKERGHGLTPLLQGQCRDKPEKETHFLRASLGAADVESVAPDSRSSIKTNAPAPSGGRTRA